jgi:hypothetical protein
MPQVFRFHQTAKFHDLYCMPSNENWTRSTASYDGKRVEAGSPNRPGTQVQEFLLL